MRKISLQYMVWKWFIYMYIITWIRVSTNIICCPTIWVVGKNVTLLLTFIAAGTTVFEACNTLPRPKAVRKSPGNSFRLSNDVPQVVLAANSVENMKVRLWRELAMSRNNDFRPLPVAITARGDGRTLERNKLTIVVCALCTKTADPSTVQRARTFWQKNKIKEGWWRLRFRLSQFFFFFMTQF